MEPQNPDGPAPQGSNPPVPPGSTSAWVYGRGASYAELTVPLETARFIGAVVSLPPGLTPAILTDLVAEGPVRVFFTPGVLESRAATSWPVILDFGDAAQRSALNLDLINEILGNLVQRVRTAGGAAPTFRLNSPIAATDITLRDGNVPIDLWPARPGFSADSSVLPSVTSKTPLVVMAAIDDGIPFAHAAFRKHDGSGTRVDFCWLQGAGAVAGQPGGLGREWTRETIDTLVSNHGPDEDVIYSRAGAAENTESWSATVMHHASHGAHVLDAAAGLKPTEARTNNGEALDRLRIIAVQLPAPVTIDTTGFRKDFAVLAAMRYIFDRTRLIAKTYLGHETAPLDLIINFSYGFTGGPHDGTDPLELDIAALIAEREAEGSKTTLVMPAGNSFADRMFGELSSSQLKTGEPCTIPWRLQPNDRTPSYLELWLKRQVDGASAGNEPVLRLGMAAPDGRDILAPITFDLGMAISGPGVSTDVRRGGTGPVIGSCAVSRYSDDWVRVLITLAPTEPFDPSLPVSASGVHVVNLTWTGGDAPRHPVACRVLRDNDPYGYRRGGRQSSFEDPLDRRFGADGAPSRTENLEGAFVRRFGSVNGLATHDKVSVVSSFFADTGRATAYASAGPSPSSGHGDVDVSVAGDCSTVLPGILAAGTRSGARVRMGGTSMAAPLYARLLALDALGLPATVAKMPTPNWQLDADEQAERALRLGTVLAT